MEKEEEEGEEPIGEKTAETVKEGSETILYAVSPLRDSEVEKKSSQWRGL